MVWYNAAIVLSEGLDALPPKVLPVVVFAIVYAAFVQVQRARGGGGGAARRFLGGCAAASWQIANKFWVPKEKKVWVPSTVAVSLGLLLGPYLPLAMLFGCVLFMWWEKRRPEQYEEIGIAIASGTGAWMYCSRGA